MNMNNVPKETICMSLFLFSLRDKAEDWLQTQPQGGLLTCEDLTEKIVTKFFPLSSFRKIKIEINNFAQLPYENLHKA